jgi:hypothetical protein
MRDIKATVRLHRGIEGGQGGRRLPIDLPEMKP